MLTEKQVRKKVRIALIEKHNRFLITEYGNEQQFFADIKKAFSNFFSAITGSAKLVSRAMILWMDVNFPFTPFKKKSTYEKMFADYDRDQKANQQQIEKAMNGMSEDGLGWLLPLAPGAVLSAFAVKTVAGMGSPEFKNFMDTSGLGHLPVVKQVLSGDPTKGWFKDPKKRQEEGGGSFLHKVFEEIQGIFLLSPIFEGPKNRRILVEGEESKTVIEDEVEHVLNLLDKMEKAGAWEFMEEIGLKRLEIKTAFIDKTMEPILAALGVSEIIINSQTPEEFAENISQSSFKDLKSMNTAKMVDDFYKKLEEIKSNPKELEKLQKALELKNIKKDADDWEEHAIENLWNLSKSEMATRALGNQEETYSRVKEMITEDLTPKHFEIISSSKTGQEYIKLIQKSMALLDNSINKSNL